MNLLFVNLSKNWGGGEKWFFSVGKALRDRGHEVQWLVYPGSALEKKLSAAELPFSSMKLRSLSLFRPMQMRRLEKWVQELGPEAVLLNGSHELKAVSLAAWRVGVPKIVFRRGVSYPIKQNFLNRWFIHHIPTHFLANSQATYEAFVQAFPYVKGLKHATIFNAIDMADWSAISLTPQPDRIIMSARLSPEKGIDRAFKALQLLKEEGITPSLHILGEGPERKKLEALSQRLGIAEQVVFHGFVEDIRPELVKAWLFLFTPTHGEGTSLALIEALALGIPCVAFDTPAMAEVIDSGETGYLAAEGDVESLAGYLKKILQDEALRNHLGRQAREQALHRFSMQRLLGELEAFLGE